MRRQNSRSARRGFTLLEVLLVLAILVILAGSVTFYFGRMQQNAYIDAAKSQIGIFEQVLDAYRLNVGSYPTTSQGLEALRTPPSDLRNPQKWQGPYIREAIPLDPWGNPYQYELLDTNAMSLNPYKLASWGPDGIEGTEDDITNLQP